MRGGEPPAQGTLVVLGLGGLALAVAAVVVFLKMRSSGEPPPDAMPKYDAPFYLLPDASTSGAATIDAPEVDAAIDGAAIDASVGSAIDAGTKPAIDAGGTPAAIDAGTRPVAIDGGAKPMSIDAAVVAPSGTGTVEIGAEPWGDIVVDGRARGRTPATLTLPAGKHTIEVIFGGEDPPRTKTFSIDLTNGATEKKFADFTKP